MSRIISILLIIGLMGCTKVYNDGSNRGNPTGASQVNKFDKVEFRVFGQQLLSAVIIRHTDPANGITIYNGASPYFATINSNQDNVFLFLEASATGISFNSVLQAQIFVNGQLFREASAQGSAMTVQISGTYRRGQ